MLKASPTLGKVSSSTEWLKVSNVHEATFVGNDVIAIASDSHACFTNLATNSDSYYRAVDNDSGDGISCFTGHKNIALFALAEASLKPRILILSHPDNKIISILTTNEIATYIHLTFSETEHLVALTGMPDYKLEIWYWRSKELLTSVSTGILTDKQTIGCSPIAPLTICQYAFYKGEISVWEAHGSANFCKLIQKRISIPQNEGKYEHTFTIEGILYLINRFGNIYQITPSNCVANLAIKWPGDMGNHDCHIEYFRTGLVVAGPSGHTKYFKKVKNQWAEVWTTTTSDPFCMLTCLYTKELLIGTTSRYALIKFISDGDSLKLSTLKEFERPYKFFDVIAPLGEFMLAMNDLDIITVIDVPTGTKIALVPISDAVFIRSHPVLPLAAIGTTKGIVCIISLLDPEKPEILTEVHLSPGRILQILFSDSGTFMTVTDDSGHFFVIQGSPGMQYEIIHHFLEPRNVIASAVSENDRDFYVFLLLSSEKYSKLAGNELVVNQISVHTKILMNKFTLLLPAYYTMLVTVSGSKDTFCATLLNCRYFQTLKIDLTQENCGVVEVLQAIQTVHQIRHIEMYANQTNILIWGMDGAVSVYDVHNSELSLSLQLHSRQSLGVKRARCSTFYKYIISLGHSGNFVCTKLSYENFDTVHYENLKQSVSSPNQLSLFNQPTHGFIPIGDDAGKNYVDIQIEKQKTEEELLSMDEKQNIQKDLSGLRQQLVMLLNKNEQVSIEEKLTIQAFNLNVDGAAAIMERGRLSRDEAKNQMLSFIKNQKQVNQYLLVLCWNQMEVKRASLRGIFTKLKVENYALQEQKNKENVLNSVKLLRNMECLVSRNDAFLPWNPIPINYLESVLAHEPEISEFESYTMNPQKLLELSGTTSSNYIETLSWRYDQLEVISFMQMHIENIMGNFDMMELRQKFNKKFQEMADSKEYEMNLVCRRNERLRHIQTELNILAELKNSDEYHTDRIIDPLYMPDEKPETIVKVEANEVTVASYVSPSHQQLLAAQMAENERKRLALLADDFRERALIVMMDGVLEHKWEDELKKDPPKPECLLIEKKPEDYTAEDLVEIQTYEEQLACVRSERERYRGMLEKEKEKLKSMSHEQIQKFNFKIGELLLFKIKIEAAICQEEMKLLRFAAYNYQRISYERKEQEIRNEMELMQQQTNDLHTTSIEIQSKILELRGNYENLNTKDKMLDKQFKANFSEQCGSGVVDQAYKIFKKRPKFQIRAWATFTILLEMAQRIVSKKGKQSEILLPTECEELFHLLDLLDQYSLSPSSVDNTQWQILCRMRRIKIESEYKLRAFGLELAETEATANAFIREIGNKKTILMNLERKFHDVKNQKLKDSTNRTVQIVMKKGLVEIPLSGSITDFDDSVLVHRSDIDDINKIIKKTGARKLKAMENGAVFRRKIIYKEWEHKKLQLSVRDMKDFVNTVEKCKITKEVQMWLKCKEKGWSQDLGQAALNREIENAINNQEKLLSEALRSLKDIEDQIFAKTKEIQSYDQQIQTVNVDVTERNLARNDALEEQQTEEARHRMSLIIFRGKLVRKVQQQHAKIMELSTMLELQKLRTYPTLTAQLALASVKNTA